MNNSPISVLKDHLSDPTWAALAREALHLIDGSTVKSAHTATQGQPSSEVAETHEVRKKIGYYNKKYVLGLDETIAALRSRETEVRLSVVETDQGIVALWLDNQDSPCGITVLKFKPKL
jgi:hypothetical protein